MVPSGVASAMTWMPREWSSVPTMGRIRPLVMRLSQFSRVKQVRREAWYRRSWPHTASKSASGSASISARARRISNTMAPAAERESMTQICLSGCSSRTMSRAMQAAW